MEELAVLAEIEHTELLVAIPTVFQPGIWRYCFFATGRILPCLEDTFTRMPIKVSNIIIDQTEYTKVDTLEELRELNENDGGSVNSGGVARVKFPDLNPPVVFFRRRYGALEGFTNNSPILLDGLMYRPGLLTAPVIEHSADAFTYDRMKFNSAAISIDNADGRFDKADYLFGNEFNLRVGIAEDAEDIQPRNLVKMIEDEGDGRVVSLRNKTDEYVTMIDGKEKSRRSLGDYPLLAQYYISNITAALDKATFHLKDKREQLAGKIPNRRFAAEEYEYLDDNLIDKDMQEAYGHCFGVPGVCLEGKRIYTDKNNQVEGTELEQYRFRFSSEITRIDRIQVKMTAGEIPDPEDPEPEPVNKRKKQVDGWTTVYQHTRPQAGSPDDWPGAYPKWKPGIIPGGGPAYRYWHRPNIFLPVVQVQAPANTALLGKGEITLHWEVAKQGGRRENSVNEVRVDGVFNNPEGRNISSGEFVTPLDIIKDVMANYSGVPYVPGKYNTDEIVQELKPLNHEIGIMFDKPISVYEAVEKLQGGCVLGFQFCVHNNKFTARLDNPNREPKLGEIREIKAAEIQNLDEAEVDWNADLYGAYTNIEYAYDYGEQAGRRLIDTSMREKILEKHRVEKEWPVSSLLANNGDAENKSAILLEDFAEMRPLIRNVKLSGKKWLALRVYDILYIDFSIRGEEQAKYANRIVRLIESAGSGRTVSMRNKTDEYVTMINEEKKVSGGREFAGENVRCQVLRVEFDAQSGVTTLDVRVRDRSEVWAG